MATSTQGSDVRAGRLVVPVLIDLRTAERDLRTLEQKSQTAGKASADAFRQAGVEAGNLGREAEGAAEVASGAVVAATGVATSRIRGLFGVFARTVSGLADLAARGAAMAGRGLQEYAASTADANGEMTTMGKVSHAAGVGLERVGQVAMIVSNVLLGLKVGGLLLAIKLTKDLAVASARAADEMAPAWNKVRVMLPDDKDFTRLRDAVSRMAAEMGTDGANAARTYFEILSNKPELVDNVTGSLDDLRVALEAEATGFVDGATAMRANAAIMKSWNIEASRTREVMDALFAAEAAGSLNLDELAASLGRTGAMVAAIGGDYRELLGLVAYLTQRGLSASEALTMVASAVGNITKPSSMAGEAARQLGVDFGAAAVQSKGLVGALREIIEATEGDPEMLSRFFGDREAINLVLQMREDVEGLDEAVRGVTDSQGALSRAVDKSNDSITRQKEIANQELKGLLREIGFEFEQMGIKGYSAWASVLRSMRHFVGFAKGVDLSGFMGGAYVGVLNPTYGATITPPTNLRPAGILERTYGTRTATGAVSPQGDAVAELIRNAGGRPFTELLGPGANYGAGGNAGVPPRFTRPQDTRPTDVAEVRKSIEDFRAARLAALAAEAARPNSGINYEQYQKRVEEVTAAVNRLTVAEMERLRATGKVSDASINELASLYQPINEQRGSRGAGRAERARAELEEVARLRAVLAEIRDDQGQPYAALEQMPQQTRDAADEAVRLGERVEKIRRDAAAAGASTAEADAQVAVLERQKAAALELARVLGPLESTLRGEQDRIAAAAFGGTITEEEAATAGVEAGQAFNFGLLDALARLRASGELTAELERALVGAAESVRMPFPAIDIAGAEQAVSALQERFLSLDGKNLRTVADVMGDVEAKVQAVATAEGRLLAAQMARDPAAQAAAEAEYAAAQGAVAAAVDEVTTALLNDEAWQNPQQLLPILERLRGHLTGAKLDTEALGESTNGVADRARMVEGYARAWLSVMDALGGVDEKTRAVLESAGEIAAGYAAAADARKRIADDQAKGGKANVGDQLAVLGGYATMVAGVVSGLSAMLEKDRIERIRNTLQMVRNTEALRDFAAAALTNVSADERDAMVAAGEAFVARIVDPVRAALGGLPGEMTVDGLTKADIEFLTKLEELTGSDFFSDDGRVDFSEFNRAWTAFLEKDLASFGSDLAGRMDALSFLFSTGGDAVDTFAERFGLFLRMLEGAEGVPASFAAKLQALIDTEGPAAAEKWFQELAAAYAEGGAGAAAIVAAFGTGLSGDEIRRIIEEGLRLTADGGTGGIVGGGADQVSRVNVAGTEVQMSALLLQLATQTDELRQQTGLLEIIAGQSPASAAVAAGPDLAGPLATLAAALSAPVVVNHVHQLGEVRLRVNVDGMSEAEAVAGVLGTAGAAFGDGVAESLRRQAYALGLQSVSIVNSGGRS